MHHEVRAQGKLNFGITDFLHPKTTEKKDTWHEHSGEMKHGVLHNIHKILRTNPPRFQRCALCKCPTPDSNSEPSKSFLASYHNATGNTSSMRRRRQHKTNLRLCLYSRSAGNVFNAFTVNANETLVTKTKYGKWIPWRNIYM